MILEVRMSASVSSLEMKRTANYSNCPLKKRPIKYELDEDPIDSDSSSNSNNHRSMDISEPENLSTKPQDLRISGHSKVNIKIEILKPTPLSPPLVGLVAGHRNDYSLDSSTNQISNHRTGSSSNPLSSYSPTLYSPTNVKNFQNYLSQPQVKGSSGPLEPISLNAPAVWPHVVPPYLHFNYSRINPHHHHQSHQIFSPPIPSYPKQGVSNIIPSPLSHVNSYRGSPPDVSPPLKTVEASYPVAVKLEVLSLSDVKCNSMENKINLKRERSDDSCQPGYVSPSYHYRESVISHSNPNPSQYGVISSHHQLPYVACNPHHRESMSSGRSSCDSGVSSPTSNSSHSTTSSVTPTNVNGNVRYQCPNCTKSYSTFSGLSKHLQFHCASQNKKSFICKFCDKVYVSLGALKMHIRTHTLPCKCDLCGKAFSRPWLLQGHIRTHTGEKPFACQHCNRAFADRSNLRAHLNTHQEVKKYSCKDCPKTFSRMSLLVKHAEGGCKSSPLHST